MNKEEVIAKLYELQSKCDYSIEEEPKEFAEVICDISRDGKVVYPDESIIVYLVREPNTDDLITIGKHWTICDGIDDFMEGIVYGESDAKAKYCKHYVSDFKEVKYFKSDFE